MDRGTAGLLAVLVVLVLGMGFFSYRTYQRVGDVGEEVERINEETKRIEQKLDSMLERPKPITKEIAVGIATRFAGLKEVQKVGQPRVISSHTETIDVMGYDGRGQILIGVHPSTGEVIKMVKQCPYPGVDTENVTISGEEAVTMSQEFLQSHALPPLPEGFSMEKPGLKTTWRKRDWELVWLHREEEVRIATDFVFFRISAETGEIASYSRVVHDVEVSLKPELPEDKAVEAARGVLGKGTLEHYDPTMEVSRAELSVVYPNHYFQDHAYHWDENQALAWVVQFAEQGEPAIDVWIDASSGQLLGGEIYERPVPELWGIPDQTGDIANIWEPALDLMQYNTVHTFLGDALEANVVGSISNGDYFILQTHGGTTTTAEDATIHHTGTQDARRLTPDEIPNNNLRYALMSFCHSAHDGTGQDFKDVLVNNGADVFHGYVESINPDPYETSLVRHLAEGRNLWNAHQNAVAETNPWFTIVIEYGPPLFCYNQLRLAPLHVDVDAPSSDWQTATILARVTNRESARQSTATNVVARLELPPGFTITSGTNPQTRPVLDYGQSWIAEWHVHAPFNVFGTRTFDVVVWSDNLGVEVDDFDDPYHKIDVVFSPYSFVLGDYLEVLRWWILAEDLYPQYTEPRQIRDMADDLDAFEDPEDVEENPSGFLSLMASIAQEEYGFGSNLLKTIDTVVRIQREAVLQYLEVVGLKIQYLEKLQEGGLVDVEEVLTELSALQIRINAAAVEAFWRE